MVKVAETLVNSLNVVMLHAGKMEEVLRFEMHPHPVEFDMYYSC